MTRFGVVALRAAHCPTVWIALSMPRGQATPTWSGQKCSLAGFCTVLHSALPTSLRRISPIAIGRTPPSFFSRAIRDAPAKYGAISVGVSPRASTLANAASWSSTVVLSAVVRESRRCCALRPVLPAAVSRGNLRSASSIISAVIGGGGGRSWSGVHVGSGACGCNVRSLRTACSSGSMTPSEMRAAHALRSRPSLARASEREYLASGVLMERPSRWRGCPARARLFRLRATGCSGRW